LARFSPPYSLPLKDPEHPRKSSNLSPKPVPSGARARGTAMAMSECRLGTDSGVRRVFWLVPHQGARLAPRADGVGRSRGRQRWWARAEAVEWPGRGRRLVASAAPAPPAQISARALPGIRQRRCATDLPSSRHAFAVT
jgi:hypothetical protein